MTRRHSSSVTGPGVGSASLIMIFVVLCLTVFASLTMVSVRAELALSKRYADSTAALYAADARATAVMAKIIASSDIHTAALKFGCTVSEEAETLHIIYETEIDENRTLHAELEQNSDGELIITSWKPIIKQSSQPDGLNLFT